MTRYRQLWAFGAGILLGPIVPANAEDWWSLQPLSGPALPAGEASNPIDRFIAAKRAEHGLQASPEADRRTLIRRLYFDLWGLPPTPEEVAAFVADDGERSYAKLVDKLLASPRYGERWARHWLDVVHYGETHGYDKDQPRPNAWPYRDYVIRAFNEDKPYARFVQEQLAGDVLWPDTVDGIVATGFIAAGPWDLIGHAEVPEEKIDGKVARHLDRDDMVSTTMNTFCSLTVQCAQCHDHKRDPVTMTDYYSLQSVFAALDRADRPYDAGPETAAKRAALTAEREASRKQLERTDNLIAQRRTAEIAALDARIEALRTSQGASFEVKGKARSGRYGYHSQVAGGQKVVKWVQVDLGAEATFDRVALFASDEYGFADFGFPHRFKVEASNDAQFTELMVLADHTEADFPRPGAAPVVIDKPGTSARYLRVTATKLWSRRNKGQPLSNEWIFALGELAVLSGENMLPVKKVTALDSIEALPRWGKADLIDGIYGRYPLADRAPQGLAELLDQAAAAAGQDDGEDLDSLVAKRDAELRAVAGDLLDERARLTKQAGELDAALQSLAKPQMVYAGTVHKGGGTFKGRGHAGGKPRDIFVLKRGDVTQPADPVVPATVPGVVPGVPHRFQLHEEHKEGERRVALAEWIVHQNNTLTWRSIVNRIWQYHFGRGIVDTANDFGRIGERPSHPALLDWLALEFRNGGGSIKDLHRLILNSATYKQSSAHHEANAEIDASNQFLWRQNRRRIEAEALRDSILTMSGKMNLKMGGPSFKDFIIEKPQHSPHYQYHKYDPDDASTHRRSVYRFIVRSQPQPFMDSFDCADPSQLVDKRGETTTVLQALALLNNKFTVRMAEHFADRVKAEPDPLGTALSLALSRAATPAEVAELTAYAGKHGLAAACRLIFNLNEFSFVD